MIRQIIPATGNWYALYSEGEKETAIPVVCWALYEFEGDEEVPVEGADKRFVTGMVADFMDGSIFPADYANNFNGYTRVVDGKPERMGSLGETAGRNPQPIMVMADPPEGVEF